MGIAPRVPLLPGMQDDSESDAKRQIGRLVGQERGMHHEMDTLYCSMRTSGKRKKLKNDCTKQGPKHGRK